MHTIKLIHGDSRNVLAAMPENSVDCIVTDPPYEIGFMGKTWDNTGVAYSVSFWQLCLRVLKPGGHLLSFSSARTYHRMTCAIEDAGFEVRDKIDYYFTGDIVKDAFLSSLTTEQQELFLSAFGRPSMAAWTYGSGFPKSLDISKAIDKAAGAERDIVGTVERWGANASGGRGNQNGNDYQATEIGATKIDNITAPATDAAKQWDGWGTALKPAHEPICVARKPLEAATVAANVLLHGTGGINIDGCRIATDEDNRRNAKGGDNGLTGSSTFKIRERRAEDKEQEAGRWPGNLIHDGSDEVLALFPNTKSGTVNGDFKGEFKPGNCFGAFANNQINAATVYGDQGSAARFFYCAKASKQDRGDSKHPTIKPHSLMRYLVRLVCPPGGTVLDTFNGSGSTGKACAVERFNYIGVDLGAVHIVESYNRIAPLHPCSIYADGVAFEADIFEMLYT